MDLQQELSRSRFVATPWTADIVAAPVPTDVDDGDPAIERLGPTAELSPAHLVDVRLAAPLARRPIDRLLRMVDLAGAAVGLIVLAPLLALAAIAIRLSSRGPVLFSQVRVGRDGRSFRCYKLRTMGNDAEFQLEHLLGQADYVAQWQRACKLDDDPRVTRVGRILRSTDLDELPQLWNVLRGEMSLVGPRPVPADEAERYGTDLATVLSVRPGMTGMWQVGGRHRVDYQQRIALDLRYVEARGVFTNLRLIVKTVALIATRRNGAT